MLAAKLGERLGQNIVIENRGGGGGNIGAAAVAKAQPDGHTLLVTTTGLAINETITKDKGFALDDLKVVAIPAWAPETLSVHPTSPAKTLSDLIAIAKTKPINFGSPGVGTSGHIANAYLFKELAKVEAVHVPFQGGAPAVNAMSGGHIDALAGAVPGYAGQLKSGLIRGIAVAAEKRLADFPDIPTYAESGFPELATAATWVGVLRAGQGQRRRRRQIEQGDQRRHERCPGTGAVQEVADRDPPGGPRRCRQLFPTRRRAMEENDHRHRSRDAIECPTCRRLSSIRRRMLMKVRDLVHVHLRRSRPEPRPRRSRRSRRTIRHARSR